jgi:hypothetical protein
VSENREFNPTFRVCQVFCVNDQVFLSLIN